MKSYIYLEIVFFRRFCLCNLSNMYKKFPPSPQMTTRVDGHSWALSAIDDLKVDKIITPLNKDHIPITDSPVVVQQHMLPPKKFVLLSAQVCIYSVKVETKRSHI